MARRIAIWALAAYCVGATVFLVLGGASPSSTSTGDRAVDIYEVEYVRLADESVVSLGTHAGQPLILNFFASTCVPCVEEMPDFEEIHRAQSDELTVVGLAVEGLRPARGIVAETGVTYETGLNPDDLMIDLGGYGLPTTVFVDADGAVLRSHSGALDADDLRGLIDELFGISPS